MQSWAERGMLGSLSQSWPGGGGSSVTYPPDAVEIARVVAFLSPASRHRSEVVLACFSRGLAVDVDELRGALTTVVAELCLAMAPGERTVAEPEEAVLAAAEDQAASWVARRRRPSELKRWVRNLAGWERADDDVVSGPEGARFVLAPLLAAFAGDTSWLPGAMEGLATAMGANNAVELAAAETDRPPSQLLDESAKTLAVLVERLTATADDVELEEMCAARRVFIALVRAGGDPTLLAPLEGPLVKLGSAHLVVAVNALGLATLARASGLSLGDMAAALEAGNRPSTARGGS